MAAIDWVIKAVDAFNPAALPPAHGHAYRSAEEEQAAFFKAIMKEDIPTMLDIAGRRKDQWQDWRQDGMSPLHYAQDSMSFQSFVQLCALPGAKVNEDYGNGWSPFSYAVNYGDPTFIHYTLGHKPDLNALAVIDAKGHTATPLHLAIERRDIETVEALIERGADTGAKANTRYGEMTPQEYAEKRGEKKIAEMLSLAPQIKAIHDQWLHPVAAAPAPQPPHVYPESYMRPAAA